MLKTEVDLKALDIIKEDNHNLQKILGVSRSANQYP